MKKGIVIPYIIAIILGIAVIAIIGLVFFGVGGGLQGEVTATDCQRKLNVYCGIWVTQGYGYDSSDVPLVVGSWDAYAPGCSALDPSKYGPPNGNTCNSILGRGGNIQEETTTERTSTRPTKEIGDSCDPAALNNDGCPGTCSPVLNVCV